MFPQDVTFVGKTKQPWGNRTRDEAWVTVIPCGIPAARHGIISSTVCRWDDLLLHHPVQACCKVLFFTHNYRHECQKLPDVNAHHRSFWDLSPVSATCVQILSQIHSCLLSESEADVMISRVTESFIGMVDGWMKSWGCYTAGDE